MWDPLAFLKGDGDMRSTWLVLHTCKAAYLMPVNFYKINDQ